MNLKDKQFVQDTLRNDGWSDEDIDAFVKDEEEMEELLIEDECFFDQFVEESIENS